jgi:large subunit ribosomal protein L7/L12
MSEEKNTKQEEVEVPKKFKELVEIIENLSVMDLAELVKVLEKKFGVSAQAPAMVAAVSANAPVVAEEEKTIFNVELTASGDNKIGVIKAVREFIQLGLKETKDLVDGAPKMVKEGVTKEEAEKIKKFLETAGATVTLK